MRVFSVLIFLLRRPSVFIPLSFELVKIMCTESKRSYCYYICLLVAPYRSTDLGVPLVGCPKRDGGLNPWGTWAQTFCFSAMGSALCLISQWCAGQSLLPAFLCGQSWSDLAADWLPVTELNTCWDASPVSCPWADSLGPALWESLGSCNSPSSLFTNRKEQFCMLKKVLMTCEGCCTFL